MLIGKSGSKNASIWDLRPNHQKSIKDFEFTSSLKAASFDQTGRYIMFAADGLQFYDTAKFNLISTFKDAGEDKLLNLQFAKFNSSLLGAGADGMLSVYSSK